MNPPPDTCPLCGGRIAPGSTTFTADLGSGLVVVRHVKASVCMQCGEEWIDDDTASRLEAVVDEARSKRREVEVIALA